MALLSVKRLLFGGLEAIGGYGQLPALSRTLTTSSVDNAYTKSMEPTKWPLYNKIIHPPTPLGEKEKPAYICHMKANVKYSPDKLWYIACLVRGMTIDEALRQLDYVKRKGSAFVTEALLEAQELAVKEHNVEFRSNLWVAESFVGKGPIIKGIRRHARKRMGVIHYRYAHYFVRLEEGTPPEHYYGKKPDGPTLLREYITERREMQIPGTI